MSKDENVMNKSANKDSQTINNVDKNKPVSTDTVKQVKEKATSIIDEQKTNVATGLSNVADSIRQVGENLRNSEDDNKIADVTARYGQNLAEKIESFSDYVDQATIKNLTRDVEKFARQQPALFIGGAFLVGLLATRFLKTSAPDQNRSEYDAAGENHKNPRDFNSAATA